MLLGADAPAFVAAVEAQFREGLIQYGTLLTHDEDEIVAALSFCLADFAAGYLALLGVQLPDTLAPVPLIAVYLDLAMALCGGDYETEVEATVVEVGDQLDERDMHASADGRRARRHRP